MATAVGLAMKITADSSGLQRGVQKTQETLDGLGGSTQKLDIIIALLAEAVELLAMQLEEMERRSFATSNALDTLADATTVAANSVELLSGKSLALTAATTAGGAALGGFGGTILKTVAMQAVKAFVPMGALAGGLYSIGAAAAASTPALIMLEDYVERVGVEARKLGTSFGFVQILEVAASRSGESIDSLRVAFTALLRNIEAARGGSASSVAAFEKLGISTADLASLSPEEIFKRIAVGLDNIADPATRSAAALVVLGENGARLQPALRSVADSEADLLRFSATLDTLDVRRINDLGDSLDMLQTATSGLGRQLILPFTGLVEGVSKAFADIIGGVAAIAAPLSDALTPFLDLLGLVIQTVGSLGGTLLKLIGAAITPFVTIFRAAGVAIEYASGAIDYLFKTINASIDSWISFFGVDSLFGSILKSTNALAESVEQVATASQEFYGEITEAASSVSGLGQAGFDAALKYQEELEEINNLKQEGEYTEEQAAEAAKRANATFKERVDLLKKAAEDQEKMAKEAERLAEADRKRVEQFRQSGMSSEEREQADAGETLLAIQREQARVGDQINAARAAGDQQGLNAAIQRLAQLDQEAARAADIASGAAAERKKQQEQEEAYQKKLEDLQAEFVRNQIKQNEKIAEKREEYARVADEIEQSRLDKLAENSRKALEVSDIRSGGIGDFIALATGREDPAIAEARKQYQKLDEIKNEIGKLGGTVELVGAA